MKLIFFCLKTDFLNPTLVSKHINQSSYHHHQTHTYQLTYPKMPKQSIQLSHPATLNVQKVIFEPVQARKIPNSEINYYRSNIKMEYPDGSEGPLLLQLPRCSTYGVSNHYGDEYDNLTLSVMLAESKDDFSEEHRQATKIINDIITAVKTFTLTDEVKNKIGKYDLELSELKTISPMTPSRDKDTKKVLADKPWYLNLKFMTSQDSNKKKICTSQFYAEGKYNADGSPQIVDIKDYIDKRGHVTPIIKIEQIYYGTKPKVLVKIYECEIAGENTGFKSFFKRAAPAATATVFPADGSEDFEDEEEDRMPFLEDSSSTSRPL